MTLSDRRAHGVGMQRLKDSAVFAFAKLWTLVAHASVWRHTVAMTRQWPNPVKPVTDVDKFMWRKLFDHNPLFTTACDKLASKRYALSICPELKTAEVLWTGDDPLRIPHQLLMGHVVIKANSGCGRNIFVSNGEVDLAQMRKTAAEWMKRGYGVGKGEWGYRNAAQCLLIERMLLENGEPIQTEYKFHVYGGNTVHIFIKLGMGQAGSEKFQLDGDGRVHIAPLDRDGKPVPFHPPPSFDRMRRIAERLAAPFDYMRCDFYELDGDVYFSELTVYPQSGRAGTNPNLRELRNAAWDLRRSWFLTSPQTGWRKYYAAALQRWLDPDR